MTASTDLAQPAAAGAMIRQYYLAMAVPFTIDLITLCAFVAVNQALEILAPAVLLSACFLLVGAGIGAYFLIRPISRFVAGEAGFAEIERPLSYLPRRSAAVMAIAYAPMMALRLLSPWLGITFGAPREMPAWIDSASAFVVLTSFNVLLTFFVVSVYLDRLCEYLFETRGVNIGVFHGRFRRKIGFAILFVAFGGIALLAADIASYSGERLDREATMDVVSIVIGTVFIYFWINRALTRPIARLDRGMHRVADGDYAVRLPVTSDDEVGHAAGRFNEMVEGLSEREYLRDTFGKYVNTSVAEAILDGRQRTGKAVDTTGDATLMFTDIEGFTGLSERLPPAEVAASLNAYLGTVVPVIQRHGGVVNAFIGDGLFASFNLPLPLDNHAAAALAAAREIQQALTAINVDGEMLRTRIGINTGTVIGVTIGTENRLTYTLLGDAVNVASRVEQLNKQFGTRILATESTVRAAGAFADCTRLGETDMRGHQGNVVIYRVGPAT